MNYLDNISYGIYVIHPVLLMVLTYLMRNVTLDWPLWLQYVALYVGMTGLTIGLAAFSYELYEKPFLRLKKKFMVVKSTNKKEE